MNIGELWRWGDRQWIVRKVDLDLQTSFIESQTGETALVEGEADAEFICNPSLEWPSVQLPVKRLGRVQEVRIGSRILQRLVDWVKLDELQMGGSLYLNPNLGLIFGDRLVVTFSFPARTEQVPVEVPRNFVPLQTKLAQQKAKVAPPPPEEPTFFDLMDDDL